MSLNKDTWSVVASFLTKAKDIVAFELTSKLHQNASYMGVTYIECKELWNMYTYGIIPREDWIINGRKILAHNLKSWHIFLNTNKYINIPPKKWILHHINLTYIDYPLFLHAFKSPQLKLLKILKKLPKLRKVQFHGCPFSQELLEIVFSTISTLIEYDISFFGDSQGIYYSRVSFGNTLILKTDIKENFIEKIPNTIKTVIFHEEGFNDKIINKLVLSRKVILFGYIYNIPIFKQSILNLNQVELFVCVDDYHDRIIEKIKRMALSRTIKIMIKDKNIKTLINTPNIEIYEDNEYYKNMYGYMF